ncbi:MAG: hypothetical protein ACTS3R_05470 [Inquilinaceae bacterium]
MVWVSRGSQAPVDVFRPGAQGMDEADTQAKWPPIVSVGFVVSASVLLWIGLVALVAKLLGAFG